MWVTVKIKTLFAVVKETMEEQICSGQGMKGLLLINKFKVRIRYPSRDIEEAFALRLEDGRIDVENKKTQESSITILFILNQHRLFILRLTLSDGVVGDYESILPFLPSSLPLLPFPFLFWLRGWCSNISFGGFKGKRVDWETKGDRVT